VYLQLARLDWVMMLRVLPSGVTYSTSKKGFPYSLLSIKLVADPGVQAVSPQVTDYKSSTQR